MLLARYDDDDDFYVLFSGSDLGSCLYLKILENFMSHCPDLCIYD